MDSEKIWYQQIRFDSRDPHLENLVVTKCIVSLDLRLLVTRPVSGGPFWSLHESFIGLSEAISHNWHHWGGRGGRGRWALPNDGRGSRGSGGSGGSRGSGGLRGDPGPTRAPWAPRGPCQPLQPRAQLKTLQEISSPLFPSACSRGGEVGK